jgi:exodeoxyribonuclease III
MPSARRPVSKPKPAPKPAKTPSPDIPAYAYALRAVPPAPSGMLRIATWNINSVRLRQGIVQKLAKLASPDVICLQETKSPDDFFPREALAKAGYEHQAILGMKGYNGVAILSRKPLRRWAGQEWCGKADCRHIMAVIESGGTPIEIHNVYVPAGGDVPDPKINPRFDHKLKFLREQVAHWATAKAATRILVGDLNVAPYEADVWSHKQLLNVVSHTPVETDLLKEMLGVHDWVDTARHLVPEPTRLYTWWSYRNQDWKASDRGRRLDHIWVTPDLKPQVKALHIVKGARDWKQPSDHVPVILDVAL